MSKGRIKNGKKMRVDVVVFVSAQREERRSGGAEGWRGSRIRGRGREFKEELVNRFERR